MAQEISLFRSQYVVTIVTVNEMAVAVIACGGIVGHMAAIQATQMGIKVSFISEYSMLGVVR